ncbi:DNA ligase [Bienertia sinuspersici]
MYSIPTCARKIGPLPTFDLLTPSLTNVPSDPTSSNEGLDKDSLSGDQMNVDEKASVITSIADDVGATAIKDDELVEPDGDATSSIPESVQANETNFNENDVVVLSGNSITTPEYVQENTPKKVKECINLVEEETDVDDSKLERLNSDIKKSIENFSNIDEEIKKEFGEEGAMNVTKDVATSKMQPVSVYKEEEGIPDIKNDDSFADETEDSRKGKAESSETIDTYNDLPMTNHDIIFLRSVQQQRNKYLEELSLQERVLADFLFYSEYKDVSRLSNDKNNRNVIEENEELRHTLESSVLLEIINPANPDIHVCMSKTDFLSLAPRTW